jgi:hypothetical protein
MNERLKEIAVKAQVEHCVSHVRLEEFARLVVQECVDIAYQEGDNVAYLALHFGVEE